MLKVRIFNYLHYRQFLKLKFARLYLTQPHKKWRETATSKTIEVIVIEKLFKSFKCPAPKKMNPTLRIRINFAVWAKTEHVHCVLRTPFIIAIPVFNHGKNCACFVISCAVSH